MTRRRIITVDCDYLHPQYAAAYLLIDGDRAAFIENNTAHAVPLLLQALKDAGLTPANVDYVIITHVHLDHAGGTSRLMTACPNATLLAHPRAARHMIDPSKLVASARQVYGDEPFERMYPGIEPIHSARVRAVEDETLIPFGQGTPLRFFHTRGHANHHLCIYDADTSSVFTGDAFGLAYPALQEHGLFIFPSTSPTDFDGPEALLSVDKIVATGAEKAYLTHFGEISDLAAAALQLREHIKHSQNLLQTLATELSSGALSEAGLTRYSEERLRQHMQDTALARGLTLSSAQWELLRLDLELNAQGLVHAFKKNRA